MIHVEDDELEKIVMAERLETYESGRATRPSVLYKNLCRFTRCFIGGSVAARMEGRDECVEGASVTLLNSADQKIGEVISDAFGDFKFDGLDPNSGMYTVRIEHRGHETATAKVDLKESICVGTIFVS
jgi:hypothetical protein